jgi:hypothetical protein
MTKMISVTLSMDMFESIKTRAEISRRSVSKQIIWEIEQYQKIGGANVNNRID